MKKKNINLIELGYDEFFESRRRELELAGSPVARVIAEYKELYRVKGENGEFLARITGKQRFTATKREDYPAVGDWVVIEKLSEKESLIRAILPRKTILKKKYSNQNETQIIATNIDTTFIVESLDRDYNLNRLERYLVIAKEGKIDPIVILNKIDLISPDELESKINQIKMRLKDVAIIPTSVVVDHGLNELNNYLVFGKTYCFIGSSGVGKSSLINKLLRKDEIKTREINLTTQRGKHTTTAREMYFLENGAILIDNPGIREVGITQANIGIENVFDQISLFSQNCKYSNCTHMHEPNCSVLIALKEGRLNKDQYENYLKLKKESEFYEMTELEKEKKIGNLVDSLKRHKETLKDSFTTDITTKG